MAIILEGERKKIDWGFIFGIAAVIGIVGSAIVYLFFVSPETTQQLTTPEQRTVDEFSNIDFRPEEILASPDFQNLRTLAPMVNPLETEIGKTNPFQ